jgi:endonuclease-3
MIKFNPLEKFSCLFFATDNTQHATDKNMNPKNRAVKIRKILKERYPEVKTPLYHETPFQLLVATILSAQCTDNQVNKVTRELYKNLRTPDDFARVQIKSIEKYIRSTGFYHNKARNIKNCSKALLENHNGRVPCTLEELVKLPGVGRKTANVVLGAVFNIPGMVVDTHVGRISKRLGLTENQDPVKIEFDLMKLIPKRDWNAFALRLIFFGREICSARRPRCPACPLIKLCPWPEKTT